MLHSGREDGLGDPAGHGILKPPARSSPPPSPLFLPAASAEGDADGAAGAAV